MKTKFTTVPPQHKARLREHIVRSPESTKAEKLEALGRDEKGRIKPLTPRTDSPSHGERPEPQGAVPSRDKR